MLTRTSAAVLLFPILTACGDDSGPPEDESAPTASAEAESSEATAPSTTPRPTPTPTTAPIQPTTRIVASSSDFGPMLFDSTGQAIYLFDVETTSRPRCYEACATAWPPVLTTGDPVAGPGVQTSLLGTTKRTDGAVQVTYNDHPLYFYAHEGKREVKCHDVFLNGGSWYVVHPGGDAAPP